jgi:hypothetical protein
MRSPRPRENTITPHACADGVTERSPCWLAIMDTRRASVSDSISVKTQGDNLSVFALLLADKNGPESRVVSRAFDQNGPCRLRLHRDTRAVCTASGMRHRDGAPLTAPELPLWALVSLVPHLDHGTTLCNPCLLMKQPPASAGLGDSAFQSKTAHPRQQTSKALSHFLARPLDRL